MACAAVQRVSAVQRAVLGMLAKDYGCLNFLESLPEHDDAYVGVPAVVGYQLYVGNQD